MKKKKQQPAKGPVQVTRSGLLTSGLCPVHPAGTTPGCAEGTRLVCSLVPSEVVLPQIKLIGTPAPPRGPHIDRDDSVLCPSVELTDTGL